MQRIFSPHGIVTDRDALEALHLDASRLLDFYQGMVRTRYCAEKATAAGHLKRLPIDTPLHYPG